MARCTICSIGLGLGGTEAAAIRGADEPRRAARAEDLGMVAPVAVGCRNHLGLIKALALRGLITRLQSGRRVFRLSPWTYARRPRNIGMKKPPCGAGPL